MATSPPSVTAGATTSFTGGGSIVVLDSGLTVSDASSSTLASATVAVTSGLVAGDTLNFVNTSATYGNIVGSYNAATGTLTLTSSGATATLAQWQGALDSVTYSFAPTNGDPTNGGSDPSRTISWTVSDGTYSSSVATSTLDLVHAAPIVSAGATASFTGGGAAATLDSALTVSAPDSGGNLTGAVVSIGSGFISGDVLNFTNQFGITGSYNAATGVLTLSGTAGIANYQAALESITYSFSPTDGDPTHGGSDTSRIIDWVVTDDAATSTAATSMVDLNPPAAVVTVAVPSNGIYGTGQKLTFVVNFDQNVAVNTAGGVPSLALSFTQGGTVQATYVSGSGTSALTFQYTIIPGELDTTGIGLGSGVALNGGTVQDTFGNAATLTLASVASTSGVLVDSVAPTVSSPTVTVAENALATTLGIQAPTDPNYTASQLTITVGGLPTDGTVTLADGTTAVTVGETLTATQLTGLEFTPTAWVFGQSSSFTYTVTDPANNSSTGSATLNVGPQTIIPPPVITTAPEFTNNATPVISGSGTAGATITMFDGTTVVGMTTADAAGDFTTTLSGDLLPGQSGITATETVGGITSAASAPVGMFEVQAPVNGISTTNFSSVQLGTLLAQGYQPSFISGAEAITLVDGTISVGPDTQEATVQRLYEGLLGRSGEVSGLTVFNQNLNAGLSKVQVAAIFLNSPEYTDAHGTMTNAQFVNSLYQGFLGRAPDPSGGAAFTARLDSGAATRAQTVIDIADSPEAKAHLAGTTSFVWVPSPTGAEANELYETALGRHVDVGTGAAIQTALNAGTPFLQIVQNVVASPEYQADHFGQTNAELVASLYENGLGRAPDPAGGQAWVNFLNAGGSQAQVVAGIATSPEASAHLTQNLGL